MNRRNFLQGSLGITLLSSAARLYAAPGVDSRFLLVFLRGGYDATNVLVPVSSSFYYEARPNIGIGKDQVLPIDADWGLHPALRETVYQMFMRNEAVFIPFAGTDDLSRSHFETQDSIELGQAPGQRRKYGSGFLNRLAFVLREGRAISFTDQLPVAMRGEAQVTNVALRSIGRPGVDRRQSELIAEMYRDTALAGSVATGFAGRDEVLREFQDEMTAASRNAINSGNFELQARRVGRLMKAKYQLGFVDVGGWDTHVGQGGTTGYLALRLQELGRGLAALADELGPMWRHTVVVLISEFGRTFRENGNRGTDHGHGTAYWLLGGAVRGGHVAGEQVRVERSALLQDRDFPVLNDYRAILGGLFSKLYGLSASNLDAIFPGATAKDFRIV